MSDLVGTLEYLHSVGVAHRDIKPENVIFESKVRSSGPVSVLRGQQVGPFNSSDITVTQEQIAVEP